MSGLRPEQEKPRTPEAAFALTVTRQQWAALAMVLTVAAAGVVLVFVNFRVGAETLAAAVGLALFLRATRSEESVGILALRAKRIDLVVLTVLTVALAVLGLWVPLI